MSKNINEYKIQYMLSTLERSIVYSGEKNINACIYLHTELSRERDSNPFN